MNARTNELTTKAKSGLMKNAMQRAACQYITEGSLRDGQRILNAMDSLNGISSDSDESAGRCRRRQSETHLCPAARKAGLPAGATIISRGRSGLFCDGELCRGRSGLPDFDNLLDTRRRPSPLVRCLRKKAQPVIPLAGWASLFCPKRRFYYIGAEKKNF